MDNYIKQITDLTGLIKTNPNKSNIFKARGDLYRKIGEYRKAINDYTKYINLNIETNHYVLNLRGRCFTKLNRFHEAINDHKTVILNNPKYPPSYNYLGQAYHLSGEIDSAIEIFSNAIQLANEHYIYFINRGLAYKDKKHYALALNDFNSATELCPNDPSIQRKIEKHIRGVK